MTQGEVIKYGLDLCKQEIGIDGSIFIPKLVSTAYINAKIDFESRTCESCKWYKEEYNDLNCNSDTIFICKLYDIAHGKDFGCNKWEAKDEL